MLLNVAGQPAYAYSGSRAFDPKRPTLVFVHGAANDHSVWSLQSRYFAWHGRNVLAVDLPGHGRSGGDVRDRVEAIADWLWQFVDAAGAREVALAGHSMGALAALEATARKPERVTHLVLAGPAVPMEVSDALLDAARANDHVAYELINGWSYSADKQLGGNRLPGVWLTGNAMRLMERSRPGGLHADLMACRSYEAGLAAAAKVRCPALVILGERDLMAPARNAAALTVALSNCTRVTLPGAGHAMMPEQPDAVLDAMRAFLPAVPQ